MTAHVQEGKANCGSTAQISVLYLLMSPWPWQVLWLSPSQGEVDSSQEGKIRSWIFLHNNQIYLSVTSGKGTSGVPRNWVQDSLLPSQTFILISPSSLPHSATLPRHTHWSLGFRTRCCEILLIPLPGVLSASLQPLLITFAAEVSPILQGHMTSGHIPGTWAVVPVLPVTHHVIEDNLLHVSGY